MFRFLSLRLYLFTFRNILAEDSNVTLLFSKFKSIRLEIHQDLLNSLFIGFDHKVFFSLALLREVKKVTFHLDIFRLSLIILNGDDVLDALLNVKPFDRFSEFTRLELGESQDVLYVQ